MSYRITTNGMLRNYQSNLYKNTHKVYNAMEKVQTGRKFNSYAEDPVNASKAFRLRKQYWNTGNQIDNSDYVISKFSTAWNVLDQIVDGTSEHPGLTGIEDALRALNDPIGSSRRVLGQDMQSIAKSVVMLMNTRNGNEFVFAGADGLNVPFTWSADGDLLYRGVSVNAPKPLTQDQFDNLEDLSSMEGYDKFIEYYTAQNAQYEDYEAWFAEENPDVPAKVDEDNFSDWLQSGSDDAQAFGNYIFDKTPDGGVVLPSYENYETWYYETTGMLSEDAFDAAGETGDYSGIEDFARAFVEERPPSYEDYQDWYVNEYVDGAAEGKIPEEEFDELINADPVDERLSAFKKYAENQDPPLDATDYQTYEKWYNDQQFEKAMIRFDEATYVDIGIGLKFDADGNVISSSAFNSALSGMDFLGYGTDEDGDPRNVVQLLTDLGKLFENCDPDTGAYPDSYTYNGVTYTGKGQVEELADRLTNKLHDAIGRVTEQHAALDSRVNYLQKNKGQLEEKRFDLNEQIENTEQEDMAVSIMEMTWARYCYEAALQIGSSILSQSLLDYMH